MIPIVRCFVVLVTIEFGTLEHYVSGRNLKTREADTSNKVHSRRHGMVPNSRRRGDSHMRQFTDDNDRIIENVNRNEINIEHADDFSKNNLTQKQNGGLVMDDQADYARPLDETFSKSVKQKQDGGLPAVHHRVRRWEYDDTYEWENGGKDYDVPGTEKKETAFEKFAKNWQKHALKAIFIFAVSSMICICLVGCCKKCCVKMCDIVCWHCRDWRDLCLNRDPTYRKARKFADDYGIELDYDQYKKIKKNYEDGFRRNGHEEFRDLSGR